jgi:hypothetical protein
MEDWNVGEGLCAASDGDIGVTQENLIGRVGNRLIRRGACATHRHGRDSFRQQRQQRHLARDVRREHRGHDGTEDERVDVFRLETRPLHELRDHEPAELLCGERAKRRARLGERRAQSGDDGDAPSVAHGYHALNIGAWARRRHARRSIGS